MVNDDIIRGTARKFTGWSPVLDCDDLSQEIALKLHAKGLLDSPERALVRHVAKMTCLGLLRKALPGFREKKMVTLVSIDDGVEPPADAPLEGIADLRRSVYSVLSRQERAVIVGGLEGRTQAEIARQLGVSQQRVWSLRQSALRKLRV
jgi:DNA-directed RNA polymerase specialized sigma24 family protein